MANPLHALEQVNAQKRRILDTLTLPGVRLMPGVRVPAEDMRWPLLSRAGNMDPRFDDYDLMAVDPVKALASGYADPAEALARARAADVQLLASHHPRGPLARSFAGLEDIEAPLLVYPGRSKLDRAGATGIASSEQPFNRMIQVAAKGRPMDDVVETIRHESGHLLDPLLYSGVGPKKIPITSRIAQEVVQEYDPLNWRSTMNYWSNEAEMRATISRLRRMMSQDRLVTTPAQAREMLDAARLSGASGRPSNLEARAAFTAEGLLRNKAAMERLMPWMTGALTVGAMVPAEEE
jgi:hypothetical protein